MSSDYQRKISVTMVPHLWIGAAAWPFLLYVELSEPRIDGLYIGLAVLFILGVIYSMYEGIRGLRNKVYSDFIMLALIPAMLPLGFVSYYLWR